MFLFDKLKSQQMYSEGIATRLHKWFPLYTPRSSVHDELLLPLESRQMNYLELEYFAVATNCIENITSSHRLLFNYKIYVSINYTRHGKKNCDYAIKYATSDSTYSFGAISYFLRLNNIFLVALYDLKVQNSILNNVRGLMCRELMRLKKQNMFSDYFFQVNTSNSLIFITAEQILSKCVLFKTKTNLILAEFTSYNEHD